MRTVLRVFLIAFCLSGAAYGQELKVPDGCRAAQDAKTAAGGYADSVVHEKTGIEMVLIPTGTFIQSVQFPSPLASPWPSPHKVTIGTPFYMGKTEVTNAQYRRFVDATGYDGKDDTDPAYDLCLRHWRGKSLMSKEDDYPLVWVSWKNAKAFCNWAGLSLPSEAQWEHACRAGAKTEYYFGNDAKDFDEYGWDVKNSDALTHPVAQKKPSARGLYDMLGNVWEWVEDDYVHYGPEYGAPTDGSARVEGRMTKIVRGGSWGTGGALYSAYTRLNSAPTNAWNDVGFRVVLPLEERRQRDRE